MRWLRFLGRRRTPLPPTDLPGCDDWQVGDLAERITRGPWVNDHGQADEIGPQHGEVLRVAAVKLIRHPFSGRMLLVLGFARFPSQLFAAVAFRKVLPRADEATAADAAFCADLRHRTRPVELETALCAVPLTASITTSGRASCR